MNCPCSLLWCVNCRVLQVRAMMSLLNLHFCLTVLLFCSQQMTQGRIVKFQRNDGVQPRSRHTDKIPGFHAVRKDYSGYKVLRVTPMDSTSYNFLKSLENQFDFWKESIGIGYAADMLVSGDEHPLLVSKLEEMEFNVKTVIDDVQPLINDQMRMTRTRRASKFDYNKYHKLGEINRWMKDFTAENRKLVAKKKILETYHGRRVYKLKISSNLADKTRPIFFLVGGTHSREWISHSTMIYMAKFLVSNYDPERTDNLIDIMEFHIVPVFNQDGYRYTWMRDRMWRKTRNLNNGSACIGTDPNRNYDVHWGIAKGASDWPCHQSFRGLSPNSTVEVRGMQDHIFSIRERVKIFVDVHSFGQFWMYPYSYTRRRSDDDVEFNTTCQAVVDAIKAVHGEVYECGQPSRLLYIASGSSNDWVYEVAGIKHAYGVELRDDRRNGTNGFLLPPSEIRPTAEEFFAGCETLVKHLQQSSPL